jgi:cellulose 1,4-beta-cellobiosidase
MKRKLLFSGILSILLIFGLVLAGCDSLTGGDDGNNSSSNNSGNNNNGGNNDNGNDNGGNNGNNSGNNNGNSGTSVPSAPTGVSATAQSSTSISVSWSAASGATSYEVYYEIGNSDTKNLAGTVSGTTYTHTGLQASTKYWYYIKAKNSAGESGYSSSGSATTSSSSSGGNSDNGGGGGTTVTKPNAPTGVTVSNEGSLLIPDIVIRWDKVSDATSYKVYRATSASGNYQPLGSSTTYNSAVDSNPLSGTSYYKVKAVNSGGESEYSNYASLSYDPSATEPGTPTISGSTSGNNITLKWSFPTGAGNGTPTSILVKVRDPDTGNAYTLATLSGTATQYTFAYPVFVGSGSVMMAITGQNSYGSTTSRTIVYMPETNKWI